MRLKLVEFEAVGLCWFSSFQASLDSVSQYKKILNGAPVLASASKHNDLMQDHPTVHLVMGGKGATTLHCNTLNC